MIFSGADLEPSFEPCPGCNAPLYDAVAHCPFCGVAQPVTDDQPVGQAAGASVAAAATAAPIRAPTPGPAAAAPAPAAVLKPKPPVLPAKTKATEPAAEPVTPLAPSPATPMRDEPPPPQAKPPRSKKGIVVTLGLAALVGAYLFTQPSQKETACDQALNQAAAMLAGGDAANARAQTVLAQTSCSGEARSKAGELQSAADKLLAVQARCERSFRRIDSQITEHRLQSARSTLDEIDTSCADSPQGKGLRTQIETAQVAAAAAEAEMHKQLADGDLKAARAAFDQISANNREHPDLATLRRELAARVKATESDQPTNAAAAAAAAAAATPAREAPQSEMAQSFLRDAQTAMNQLKFDTAKTYVESARRLDPNNPLAPALARRIRERELQYLEEATSIK
ncbi:hypothetical protein BLL52_0498 [Rhodoferax antarcticus ANT.BR]|uniref:Uncharacterized protein n=1 Tax=Rhodoferax antarcticus ANT.BR TaxID=1111071 RepID=A0A1Q8YJY6_9BURK|nr:hypothetical protein BLL52_0498 [Rhodoferax antarcticus ANT.BR]